MFTRLVGSFKLQGSFAKEPYKRDDILQKRPIILKEPTNDKGRQSCSILISNGGCGVVSLAKEPHKRVAVLQKRPMI